MPRYQIVRMIGLKLNRNKENSFFLVFNNKFERWIIKISLKSTALLSKSWFLEASTRISVATASYIIIIIGGEATIFRHRQTTLYGIVVNTC